jgi:hypothetical protein
MGVNRTLPQPSRPSRHAVLSRASPRVDLAAVCLTALGLVWVSASARLASLGLMRILGGKLPRGLVRLSITLRDQHEG